MKIHGIKRIFPTFSLFALPMLLLWAMGYRAHFGVDFTDESFYVAMAYNFYRGALPFIDEVNLLQTTAWLLRPLVALYGVVAPDFGGLVLFMRECYLAFLMLLTVVGYKSLSRVVNDRCLAMLLVLSCAAFIPFNIFSLSYNTLGSGCFAIGAFLLARAWLYEQSIALVGLAGLAHGVAALAYPSMAVPLALIYPLLFLRRGEHGWRYLLLYGGVASAVCSAVLVPMSLASGWQNVAYSVAYTGSFGMQHLANLFGMVAGYRSHFYIVVFWFAAVYWAQGRVPWVARLLVIFFPVFWLAVGGAGMPHANWYVVNYGLAAPLLVVLLPKDVLAKCLVLYIWLPALFVGAVCAWSSSNAGIAAANGLIVGCVVTSVLLSRLYQRLLQQESISKRSGGHLYAPLLFVLLLVSFQFASVYRDAPVSQLDYRVEAGPYDGLYTTPTKAVFVRQLARDLGAAQAGVKDSKMLSFSDFPAAYLFATARPATNTAWLFPSDIVQANTARADLVNRFEQQGDYPDVIVKLDRIPYDASGWKHYRHSPDDPLMTLARGQRYRLAVARQEYEIYVRRP